ncbi:hypothetical protein J6590_079544 [Homalodisca vitripennis]|nr:hypothetical protein J6590_079544 [Homalodisca vitripennis]
MPHFFHILSSFFFLVLSAIPTFVIESDFNPLLFAAFDQTPLEVYTARTSLTQESSNTFTLHRDTCLCGSIIMSNPEVYEADINQAAAFKVLILLVEVSVFTVMSVQREYRRVFRDHPPDRRSIYRWGKTCKEAGLKYEIKLSRTFKTVFKKSKSLCGNADTILYGHLAEHTVCARGKKNTNKSFSGIIRRYDCATPSLVGMGGGVFATPLTPSSATTIMSSNEDVTVSNKNISNRLFTAVSPSVLVKNVLRPACPPVD